jgi:hypothetical protein
MLATISFEYGHETIWFDEETLAMAFAAGP